MISLSRFKKVMRVILENLSEVEEDERKILNTMLDVDVLEFRKDDTF